MKKALLVTWFNGVNYGTLLQAYCLKEIIENPNITGFQTEKNEKITVNVLNYIPNEQVKLKEKIFKFLKKSLKEKINKLIIFMENIKLKKNIQKREKIFEEYRNSNLALFPKKRIVNKEELKLIKEYDYYIVGSDQVWNPTLLNEVYLLNWVDNKKIKFSYAPSLCVNEIPNSILDKYKILDKFNNISVRENTYAVKQLKTLLNKEINVVVDPVLLYGRKALLKKCKKLTSNKEEYIFSYLLGNNKKTRKYAHEYSKSIKMNLKSLIAINPLHIANDRILRKNAIWNINPFELINIIYNSRLVITDSFHVMVIAVLLHKDFTILERENSNSQQNNRIINFLKMINLEEKLNYKPENKEFQRINENKWNQIDKIIDIERKKSFDYLINCLNIKEEKNEK